MKNDVLVLKRDYLNVDISFVDNEDMSDWYHFIVNELADVESEAAVELAAMANNLGWKDKTQLHDWYIHHAADNGHMESQYHFGLLIISTPVTAFFEDDSEEDRQYYAYEYFKKAADHGHSAASYCVAKYLYDVYIDEENDDDCLDESVNYCEKALVGGHELAVQLMPKLYRAQGAGIID